MIDNFSEEEAGEIAHLLGCNFAAEFIMIDTGEWI